MNKSGKKTIYDIAREAHVSPATVSRVMGGAAEVSDEKRALVQSLISLYGYTPSNAARSLKTRRTRRIGFIVPDITNPYFANLYFAVEQRLAALGYTSMLCNSGDDPEKEINLLRVLSGDGAEAIVFQGVLADWIDPPERLFSQFREISQRTPIIVLSNSQTPGCARVAADEESGIRQLAAHLTDRGYRTFGFLGGGADIRQTISRRELFARALAERGMSPSPQWIIEGGYDYVAGKRCMYQLLKQREQPEAILCFNDYVASGALHMLHVAGIAVPGGMALCGFDGIFLSEITYPMLTTIAVDYGELTDAVTSMIERVSGGEIDVGAVETVAMRLIDRGTT